MSDDNPPFIDYVDPRTGRPWHACPRCDSLHVRGVEVGTVSGYLWGHLEPTTPDRDYGALQSGGLRLAFEMHVEKMCSRGMIAPFLWCGACHAAWRLGGAALITDAERAILARYAGPWHEVRRRGADDIESPDGSALAALTAIGCHPVEARRDAFDGDAHEPGDGLRLWQDALTVGMTWWLDETNDDGSSGVNLHPRNVAHNAHAYCDACGFPPFADIEEWPGESVWVDEVAAAYDFATSSAAFDGLLSSLGFEPIEG
jgi:hypothetical protein